MNEIPSPTDTAATPKGPMAQTTDWVSCGWQRVQQQKPLWFGTTAVYFILAFLLKLIPFMGNLVLVLITPMLLGGFLLAVQTPAIPAAPATDFLAMFRAYLVEPGRGLFQIFSNAEKIFPTTLLCIITLGLVLLVISAGYIAVGGSMISGLTATDLHTTKIPLLLGMLVMSVLHLLLAMGLLYSVPLTLLDNRLPLDAITESFTTCARNTLALACLGIVFFLPYVLIVMAFNHGHWLGYLLLLSLGFVTVPVFIASVYCSYLTFYPESSPTTQ
jgi:hypothetical protein